jgi:xylulokinase
VAESPFETVGRNVEMSVDSLRAAIRAAFIATDADPKAIAGIAFDSMGETGAPFDGSGRIVGPLIAWHDPRGEKVMHRLDKLFGAGLPARVGQATRVQSSIAKIGWFIQHGAEVRRWLGVSELGLWMLTGVEATERSLACRTGAFDIRARTFIPEVIEAAGAPAGIFADVLPAGAAHGVVSREGAAWLGIRSGIPVTVAGHDHMVGAIGVGILDSDLLDSIGTAETLVRYVPASVDIAKAVGIGADVSIDPSSERLALMAGDLRPGRIVESARQILGEASFEELETLSTAPHGTIESGVGDGQAFLEQLRSQEATRAPEGPIGVRWRGLVEAMAAYMWRVAEDFDLLAPRPTRIVLIGGGARSDTWARAKLRLAGLPVVRSRVEAAAYGSALFAGVAAGAWPSVAEAPRHRLEEVLAEAAAPR